MTKIIRLTESDLTKLVSRAIKEQQKVKRQSTAKRFITEAMAESQSLVDKAEQIMSTGQKADPSVMSKITGCIKREGLTHLAILTTGAGAYALGLIAAVFGSGVGAPLVIALSGACLIILAGIGIEGKGVADEVNRLLSCYNGK